MPIARRAALAAVLAVAIAPFAPSLGYGFALDDANYIQGHMGVLGPFSPTNLFLRDSWGRSQFDTIGHYRPIGAVTFWVDQHVGGGRPWVFHLTNLLLYLALLVALERFLRSWCRGVLGDTARLLAVAVFGVLAVHADVVPSIAGRAELLAALFSLAAVAAVARSRPLRPADAVLATGAVFLALLSKESAAPMAVFVPFLAIRGSLERNEAPKPSWLAFVLGPLGALLAVVAFRMFRMPFMSVGPERVLENPLFVEPPFRRFLGALDVLGLYVRHIATGMHLAPDYSFSEPPILRDGFAGITLGGAFLIASAALVVTHWKRSPRVADALLAMAASYLPVSNFVVPASAIGDRLLFSPTMWLVVATALVLRDAVRARATRAVSLVLATLAFAAFQAVGAAAYAATWRDDVTLASAALRNYPNVFRTQRNLAHALADAGNHEGAAWHEALAEAIRANFPMPVAREAIASAWEHEPLSNQLGQLSALFGTRATCTAVRTAELRLRSWGDGGAGDALARWEMTPSGACAAPH